MIEARVPTPSFGRQLLEMGPTRDAWRGRVRETEDLGFTALFVSDHLGDQLAPLLALQAAADVTSRLRIGPQVLCNDLRDPLVLAKELATLDLLSDGRLEVGIGAGWHFRDYEARGATLPSAANRIDRLGETLVILKRFFTGKPFSFSGEHYTINAVRGEPRPAQAPRPPIMVGGGGDRVLSLAAAGADVVGLHPRMRRDGRGLEVPDLALNSVKRKTDLVRRLSSGRTPPPPLSTLVLETVITPQRRRTLQSLAAWIGAPEAVVESSPHFLVGTTATIRAQIQRWHEELGIERFILQGLEGDVLPLLSSWSEGPLM